MSIELEFFGPFRFASGTVNMKYRYNSSLQRYLLYTRRSLS